MNARIWPSVILPLLLAVTGCAQPATPGVVEKLPAKAPGRYVEDITVGGVKRQFVLRVPTAYDATKRLPVVLLLHGWTSNATAMESYSRFADKAEKEGFFLVTPQGLGNSPGWNVGWLDLSFKKQDEIAFLTQTLDQVEKEVGVDPMRIYAAGHSNGAMLAHLAGSRMGKRLAAIGAVAGTVGLPARGDQPEKLIPDPETPISVMLIHGKNDAMVGYAATSKAVLVGLGALESAQWWARKIGASTQPQEVKSTDANVVTDTYSGGKDGTEVVLVSIGNGVHDWPGAGNDTRTGVKATDLMWDFFKAHPKKAAG